MPKAPAFFNSRDRILEQKLVYNFIASMNDFDLTPKTFRFKINLNL